MVTILPIDEARAAEYRITPLQAAELRIHAATVGPIADVTPDGTWTHTTMFSAEDIAAAGAARHAIDYHQRLQELMAIATPEDAKAALNSLVRNAVPSQLAIPHLVGVLEAYTSDTNRAWQAYLQER